MPKGSNEKKGRGRPTAYKPEYCDKAYKLCLLGATDAEMASFFGVAESTLNNWKNDHLEFLESLKAGKEDADAAIAQSLYQQALDGNTTAQIFWLKNRRSKSWRDKQEVQHDLPKDTSFVMVINKGKDAD